MKTAVTVLQEMMVKLGQMPEYECLSQSGPKHQSLFEYRCEACGEMAIAAARSKKEAKQEVARVMLQTLALKGHPVPPPYGLVGANSTSSTLLDDSITAGSPSDTRSYVALLKELCSQYRLAEVEYELVGDTGPPHLRHFTIKACIGQHERIATSTTKKAARQLAAEKLYSYLRENLARVTNDFDEKSPGGQNSTVIAFCKPSPLLNFNYANFNTSPCAQQCASKEDEALVRAHDKAMERHPDPVEEFHRPDMGQRIADYHIGLVEQLDEQNLARVLALLDDERPRHELSPERVVGEAAALMRLEATFSELPPLTVLELTGCSPELAFGDDSRAAAARRALSYLDLTLRNKPERRRTART